MLVVINWTDMADPKFLYSTTKLFLSWVDDVIDTSETPLEYVWLISDVTDFVRPADCTRLKWWFRGQNLTFRWSWGHLLDRVAGTFGDWIHALREMLT